MEESKIMQRTKISDQVKTANNKELEPEKKYDGSDTFISTGSTLLDKAITGGRTKYGGIPGGIMVEIFGPSGCGKTSLLCEIAGNIQRQGGDISFNDPEGRLNKQFARIFDLDPEEMLYSTPNTIPEVFQMIRKWEVKDNKKIHGILADSLAALSTDLEMENEDGDKMGMRRAKEFSQELRRTCRILLEKNLLLACSNQQRVNANAGPYGQQYISPGGEAIGFYSSLRLRCMSPQKIKIEKTIAGKKTKKVIGVETKIEVYKSSVWKPYRDCSVCIIFDYGIDDIRTNLQYVKTNTKSTTYVVEDEKVGTSLEESIQFVEKNNLEDTLKEQTIRIWDEIEAQFVVERKPKRKES